MDPVIIIGSGLAGYTVAREYRKLKQDSNLIIISSDKGEFYSKPMLSNALANGKNPDEIATQSADNMAEQLNAEIITQTWVESIDKTQKIINFKNRSEKFSKLVLALGAQQFQLPIPGNHHCLSVNNLLDYERFREQLEGKEQIGIIGSGLIGCEFANDLLAANKQVTVIGRESLPLGSLLPADFSRLLMSKLEMLGVKWLLNNEAVSIDFSQNRYGITLKDDSKLDCELILSAVGLKANTKIAAECGIAVARGIKTNQFLQTNREDIFAIGDCAEIAGFHLPFVLPIMQGARSLAKTLADTPTAVTYPPMPVVIKTPACPLTVSPPGQISGSWSVENQGNDLRGLYHDENSVLRGFALSGDLTKERMKLTKQLPNMLDSIS